eukprot:1160534-Pelagomonas_calceolata.AAC.8
MPLCCIIADPGASDPALPRRGGGSAHLSSLWLRGWHHAEGQPAAGGRTAALPVQVRCPLLKRLLNPLIL